MFKLEASSTSKKKSLIINVRDDDEVEFSRLFFFLRSGKSSGNNVSFYRNIVQTLVLLHEVDINQKVFFGCCSSTFFLHDLKLAPPACY